MREIAVAGDEHDRTWLLPRRSWQRKEQCVQNDLLVDGLLLVGGRAIDERDAGVFEKRAVSRMEGAFSRVGVESRLHQTPVGAQPIAEPSKRLVGECAAQSHVLVIPED